MGFPRIPDEIIIACYEEHIKQFIPSYELGYYLMANKIPIFSYKRSSEKYGKSEDERFKFWAYLFASEDYELFFKKFPRNEEINLNGVKYVL